MRKSQWFLLVAAVSICAAVGLILVAPHDTLSPLDPHVKTFRVDYFGFQPFPTVPASEYRYRKSIVTDVSPAEVDRVMKAAYPSSAGWKWEADDVQIGAWRGSEYVCYVVNKSSPPTISVVEKTKLTSRQMFVMRWQNWASSRL